MTRADSSLLVLLAALAGWMDALSFTALGKVFTSFQSGNLIFLGLGVDEGDAQLLGEPTGNPASRIVLVALGAAAMGIQGATVFTLRIPGVVTNAIAGLLSHDHEFQSIGSTRRRTLEAHQLEGRRWKQLAGLIPARWIDQEVPNER